MLQVVQVLWHRAVALLHPGWGGWAL
jgi:hypothetical protein